MTSRLCLLPGCLVAFWLLLFATPAQAWWNGSWSYRMKLHLDTTPKGADIAAPVGHVQVLIRLNAGNFNFDTANPDGADLRVIAGDDRTPLHFQIEHYDSLADQVAFIWVDMADLPASTDTSLFLYWGNKSAPAASDGKATFSADQVLVYHFAADTGPPQDSTSYANNALTGADHGATGLADGDAKFTGRNVVILPKSATLKFAAGAPVTWSMWLKPGATPAPQSATLFTQSDGANGLTIGLDQGVPYVELLTAGSTQRASGGPALDPTTWHELVVSSGDKLTLFVDGDPKGEIAAASPALAAPATLGGQTAAPVTTTDSSATPPPDATPAATPSVANGFLGEIDEFEIARATVSPSVVKFWMTRKNPEKFLTFDVAEQNSFLGNGYVGVIARSVTPDAWFVIGLLAIMSLISWWAMISKAIFLSRVAGANARFEAQYRLISAPGATAGAAASEISTKATPQLRRSPLYRLYRVGKHELDQRLLAGLLEADGRLAPQAITAMRAAVDATLVREAQRLGATMVLLTICISGGPFLGLLGTVVGVMITFAAIAQAGDVNVNAIAPGVAAALLATVAGLFVAIPALFGYNYLLTRIRDLSAQMNAFANEMVARMAEEVRRPAREHA